ncbi:MAG: SAM-dependent methyltransferase [Candidatus Nucleicultricaceae bacterium]
MPTEDLRQKFNSLHQIIQQIGPVSIETYMRYALNHETKGYYRSKEAIGGRGDFITAPEVSQLFGEMIALWFIDHVMHSKFLHSDRFSFIECGPGRGTLMRDVLRTFGQIKSFTPKLDLHFLEINPSFKNALLPLKEHHPLTFHERIESLLSLKGKGPFLILANEFLDVFPVRQFILHKHQWHEIKVVYVDSLKRFQPIVEDNPCPLPFSLNTDDTYQEGDILEYSSEQQQAMLVFEELLSHDGGFGLWIDYGYTTCPKKSTLQAVQHHKKVDPFKDPGLSDLTTLIDFGTLYKKFQHHPKLACTLIDQGDFLKQQGIDVRAAQLIKHASKDDQHSIEHAVQRLTHPNQMGRLFKVLALRSQGDTPS